MFREICKELTCRCEKCSYVTDRRRIFRILGNDHRGFRQRDPAAVIRIKGT